MSDFEPSPRSSKRRRIATPGAGSAKTQVTPSTSRPSSKRLTSTSRRHFKARDSEDELAQESPSTNVRDSTYGSKEDSLNEDEIACVAGGPEAHASSTESADELAQHEVTMTPTKSQRTSSRHQGRTPEKTEKASTSHNGQEKAETASIGTRSSGRERKQPRRFSSAWEDNPNPGLPKGVLTPSRKGNKTPRKSVAFEQDRTTVIGDLGFKDLDTTTTKKTQRARRRKEPYQSDEAQEKAGKDVHQIAELTMNNEESRVPEVEEEVEEEPFSDVPEGPNIAITPLLDPDPAHIDLRLDPVKSLVLSRLTGQILTPLTSLEAEYSKLYTLLSATIKSGEGNSILLLGSRGAGKTCLVETAIANLATECAGDFHVVRLSGFHQTDDKLALREIWRQLGREMQVEEDETAQINTYADTMASLLHLLSHPEELAETLESDAMGRTTKSVVFVLDEFDLFTTHPRQTLLYNLFDIAQARKAPIAVIGCSARVDVSDTLEKRVKSRFSHRWIHISHAKNLQAFEEIARAALLLRDQDRDHERQNISVEICDKWNAFVEKVFIPSSHVQRLLMQCFYTTKSIPDLFSSLYVDVATIISLDQINLRPAMLSDLSAPDTVLDMLPSIPDLHLSLLISAARLDAIYNAAVVTFALVYSHYVDLVSRARLQASAAGSIAQATKLWNRDVAAAAWEDLAQWEIVLPAANKGIGQEQTRMWRCDVVLEEIVDAVGGAEAGMSDVVIRWCKEI
ncbi:hypothetical protein EPUS_02221 [Endocarpon pusillum Z07020]|uniref:Uncharacterized protein n=1 Tax=Endocarpon pusillum (strain Z07020 / HMAS-L-300199) TaxID=1263415 RepID=U1GG95_ENDPU|nr:uncharacterized protein EPUS_02221 [Endocarpon pusillum Z07020]ERF76682.1 hypothetical protein EPUS_02221 [Endocarpon pusillum Z07020]